MHRRGFTLIETLVVAGIVGVLLALLLPAIQRVRGTMDAARCANNMRQIGTALHLYHNDHGRLPVTTRRLPRFVRPVNPEISLGWPVHLLPYLDHRPLYEQALAALEQEPRAYRNPPHVGYATVVPVFVCPSDSRLAQAVPDLDGKPTSLWSYVGNGGYRWGDGVLAYVPGIEFGQITDGMSTTLLLGERPPPDSVQSGIWYSNVGDTSSYPRDTNTTILIQQPGYLHDEICFKFRESFEYGPGRTDRPCDRLHYWSMHPGGGNFLFCDNSVRFVPYSARAQIPALASRNGQEQVTLPE